MQKAKKKERRKERETSNSLSFLQSSEGEVEEKEDLKEVDLGDGEEDL